MNFKNMIIMCIQEDCKKASDLKNACGIFERYMRMTDLEIIQIYEEYFGFDKINDDDAMCMD